MRISVDIDDQLLAEAMAVSGLKTKRRTIETALRLLARRTRQASLSELYGAIEWDSGVDPNVQPARGSL